MGLSQVIERPRNWIVIDNSTNDTISVADDGRFMSLGGFTNWDNIEGNRSNVTPYNIVVERIFFRASANSLTGASTNTITLRDDTVDTTGILSFDDTDGTGLIEVTGLNVAIAAGSMITFRINSDSAGTINVRSWGISYRIVNPQA